MWIEEVAIENVKCFDKQVLRLGTSTEPYRWITLLGENGTGKSTILQALSLLLAGPEGANQLLKPLGWLKSSERAGKISINIHQGDSDPGHYKGPKKERRRFRYTLYITGGSKITINNKIFTEPIITEDTNSRVLPWLRENALLPKGKGWFGAGYGAFRRLTRLNRILVPSLQTPLRYTNFYTQFKEDEPLEAFETWMVYLDYRISKSGDNIARKQKEWGISAINRLLPKGNRFDSIDDAGRIYFDVNGTKVNTIALSDGFRSVLALSGDLIWRLIEAFPDSEDPLKEEGVVMIDELDIHLHPTWQRTIASLLRENFPNIQFIMATHSPLVAAGAGSDALTYRLNLKQKEITVDPIKNIFTKSVDRILQSEAFGLVSPYSPETQDKIDRYYNLKKKRSRSMQEESELQQVIPFVEQVLKVPEQGSLDYKIDQYLKDKLK